VTESVSETVAGTVAETVTKPKRIRKPVLPAKLKRHQVFAYWLVSNFVNKGFIDPTDIPDIHSLLNLFSSIDEQKTFYQDYLDNSKQITKDLNGIQKKHGKPEKPVKKPKKKTDKKSNKDNNDILAQLETIVDSINTKDNHNDNDNNDLAQLNTSINTHNDNDNDDDDDDDDEEVLTSVFNFNGTDYLIDDNNIIYDIISQDRIGYLSDNIIIYE
jgi:hypothetical protein